MPRLSRSASLLVALLLGCSSEVPAPTQMKPQPTAPAVAPKSAETQKPVEVAKADKVETAASTSVPALEEPTADGHNWLKRDELEAGWVRLFDGQTLFGWKANNDVAWSVKDGVVSAETGESGLLCTTSRFADYELRCDFKLATGGNSGIFLRTPMKPTDPGVDCYELNMCDEHPSGFLTGSLVKRAKPEKIGRAHV